MVFSYQYIHRLFQALNFNFFTLSQQGIKYSNFSDLCQKQEAVKEVLGSLAKVRVFLFTCQHLFSLLCWITTRSYLTPRLLESGFV